jgi:hypothetical protein
LVFFPERTADVEGLARRRPSASVPAPLMGFGPGPARSTVVGGAPSTTSMNNKGEGESDHRDSERPVVLANSGRVNNLTASPIKPHASPNRSQNVRASSLPAGGTSGPQGRRGNFICST